MKDHVVSRKPPNYDMSLSVNCVGGDAILGDLSIGDSKIRFCNERYLVEHEISLANKVWSFAKEKLDITGRSNDEEHTGRIRTLEARDQNARGRKGKKCVSMKIATLNMRGWAVLRKEGA